MSLSLVGKRAGAAHVNCTAQAILMQVPRSEAAGRGNSNKFLAKHIDYR